jgi:hypothetical protein
VITARRLGALGGALLVFISVTAPLHALGPTVTAVRTMDENVLQANQIDVSATALAFGQMTLDAAAAYDAGLGGVIDFDNGSFAGPRTIDATFAGGARLLRITNSVRDWSIGNLGFAGGGAISNNRVIFLGGPTTTNHRWVMDGVYDALTEALRPERVTKFGFTIIDSGFNGVSNTVSATAFFSDGASEAIVHTIPLGGNTFDTFFGFEAPAGRFITELTLTGTNNTAGEDFAFVTMPVPEPTTGALAPLLFATLASRQRRLRSERRAVVSPAEPAADRPFVQRG